MVVIKWDWLFKNLNMTPKLEKIVINMGLGIDGNDQKAGRQDWLKIRHTDRTEKNAVFTDRTKINPKNY